MIKENVLSALNALGFRPEKIEEFGYRIDYEGFTILYSEEEDESKSIYFISPGVYEITAANRAAVLEAMIALTCDIKYVQPVIVFDDRVWLNYQHYIGDNEVTPELVEHMIHVLAVATVKFHNIINQEDV